MSFLVLFAVLFPVFVGSSSANSWNLGSVTATEQDVSRLQDKSSSCTNLFLKQNVLTSCLSHLSSLRRLKEQHKTLMSQRRPHPLPLMKQMTRRAPLLLQRWDLEEIYCTGYNTVVIIWCWPVVCSNRSLAGWIWRHRRPMSSCQRAKLRPLQVWTTNRLLITRFILTTGVRMMRKLQSDASMWPPWTFYSLY